VVVLLQERTFKRADDPTPFDRLLRAVYYSLWCYLLLSVLALIWSVDADTVERVFDQHKTDPAGLVWRGVLAIIGPALAVCAATLIWQESGANQRVQRALPLVNERHQQPTGWDFWFRKGIKTHVRIVLADGSNVWGYYGEQSFASYAKDGRDLFLECIYRERMIEPDDASDDAPGPWFGKPHPNGRGGWVDLADAVRVEFYDLLDGTSTETTAESSSSARRRPSGSTAPKQPAPRDSSASAATSAAEEGLNG
jgi:hypothetical protein